MCIYIAADIMRYESNREPIGSHHESRYASILSETEASQEWYEREHPRAKRLCSAAKRGEPAKKAAKVTA